MYKNFNLEMRFVIGWFILLLSLSLTTFGAKLVLIVFASLICFVLGAVTLLYARHRDDAYKKLENFMYEEKIISAVEMMRKGKESYKLDKRLTGSQVIDEQLQEILDFVIRDYVYPWYDQLSDSDRIPHEIRVAVQNIIVAFSNRIKEADWIPYLTTRLVDDAASHLRLYRQAKSRVKTMSVSSEKQSGSPPETSLEAAFFDLELSMENGLICRDHLAMNPTLQRCYLQQLADIVLFYLSPELDFHCLSLRYLTREVLVNSLLVPLLAKLSDPDFINQCKDFPVTSDVFLTVLKVTDSVDELMATKEILNKEISVLRSRDAGGDAEIWVKQQLSSLNYLGNLVDNQIARLRDGGESGPDYSRLLLSSPKLFQLPLDVLLKNNVALTYFIEHMRSVSLSHWLFFHLNIEGWKSAAQRQLTDGEIVGKNEKSSETPSPLLAEQYSQSKHLSERLRESAFSIYEQYLTDQAGDSRIILSEESIVKRLLGKIKTEKPNENWFDEVQNVILDKMQNDERCLSGFRNSASYVKLLSELDLLRGDSTLDPLSLSNSTPGSGLFEDEGDSTSLDRISLNSDTASLPEFVICPTNPAEEMTGSVSDGKCGAFTLHAEIIETGLVHERGKTFGVYAVSVTKKYESGSRESWQVYRRYSDFYELHQKIKEKFPELSKLSFPGKKTFGNMERKTLERRMIHLNNYLRSLFNQGVLAAKPGLIPILLTFFGPSDYRQSNNLSNAIDSLFRMSIQAVRTVPDSVMSSVDGMVDNLSRVLQVRTTSLQSQGSNSSFSSSTEEAVKVGASLDTETADNIPMRILLLLMTEVFELKASSQWLRRRLVILLRQIVRTMFGDIVNRRIIEYVSLVTSPCKVASYLAAFKEAFWPNGFPSEKLPLRDPATRLRTRVAAKAALISSISDDIKHILGSETTLTGLSSVFSLLQITKLNTRFLSVVLEGALVNVFPHAAKSLQRLHAKSERIEASTVSY